MPGKAGHFYFKLSSEMSPEGGKSGE